MANELTQITKVIENAQKAFAGEEGARQELVKSLVGLGLAYGMSQFRNNRSNSTVESNGHQPDASKAVKAKPVPVPEPEPQHVDLDETADDDEAPGVDGWGVLGGIMGAISAVGGLLLAIRTPSRHDRNSFAYWIVKSFAVALAPVTLLLGLIGLLLGGISEKRRAGLLGALGLVLAGRHIYDATREHNGFERSFGPSWRARIAPTRKTRMLPRRYTPGLPAPQGVTVKRDLIIGQNIESNQPIRADIWMPPLSVPRTGMAVLYFHGSGWHYMDKDMGTRPLLAHLASQGHVVMDVAYTLAPKAHWRSMVHDVKQSIAWMKGSHLVYEINPGRIVLMGGSAGAHLSLLAAYTAGQADWQEGINSDTSVRAVVAYYPPTDLTLYDLNDTQMVPASTYDKPLTRMEAELRESGFLPPESRLIPINSWLPDVMGCTIEDCPDEYHDASPVNHVDENCPPTLILHGTHDWLVPEGHPRALHNKLCDAEVKSVLVEIPGADHGFDMFVPTLSPSAQSAMYDVERFLALLL